MKKQFNQAQRQAIAHFTGPCLALAGPGSGKTTVIVERLCRLLKQGVAARNILVLTFTRAAAAEMRERFMRRVKEEEAGERETAGRKETAGAKTDRAGEEPTTGQPLSTAQAGQVAFGTFHSAFFQILRYSGGYGGDSVLRAGEKAAFLEEAARGMGIWYDREGWIPEVLKEIGDVKGNGGKPEGYRPFSCRPKEFLALYRGYQELLKSRRRLDFDDMLLQCLELFYERPEVLEIWQERFEFILIDEYQDSSRIQCELAKLLAAPQDNVMAVGDDDQSIYGFRGAAPERMRDFLTAYPQASRYLLDINYRCHAEIVAAAGRLIKENQNRLPKKIRAAEGGGQPLAGRQAAGAVTCREYAVLREENEAVAAQIQEYHRAGLSYGEMAVLYRTNQNPAQLLRMLELQGIPVQVKGTGGGFYDHWICEDFCAYLAAACGSTRRADWLRVVSRPERYISRSALGMEPVSLDKMFDFYAEDRRRLDLLDRLSYDLAVLKKVPPYAAISHLRRYMGYDEYLQEQDRSEEGRLSELAEQIQETADGCQNAGEWLGYVQKKRAAAKPGPGDRAVKEKDKGSPTGFAPSGVQFMTMHGSKGLEFPVVFLVDANEGITPYKRADSPESIEEERRLFYVAMTRAKRHLHISWTKERFHRQQSVSRFVREAGL